jgi:hypothetical protein
LTGERLIRLRFRSQSCNFINPCNYHENIHPRREDFLNILWPVLGHAAFPDEPSGLFRLLPHDAVYTRDRIGPATSPIEPFIESRTDIQYVIFTHVAGSGGKKMLLLGEKFEKVPRMRSNRGHST